MELIEVILSKENLNRAYKKVVANKGASGVDGVTVEELGDYIRENREKIVTSLRNRTYIPKPVRRVYIPSRYRSYAVGTDFLITNRYHRKIDRDGISYIIKKYVDAIRKKDATFPEHVHCHMFRHSKAMHMLEAGINIVYIRDFLGHEDISTTMVYVRADNRLKNDAVNALAPKVTEERDFPDWNKDKYLLQFLNSLK